MTSHFTAASSDGSETPLEQEDSVVGSFGSDAGREHPIDCAAPQMQTQANTCLELEQALAEISRLKSKLADMEKYNRIKTIELEMYHIRDEKASIEKDIAAKQEQKVELAQRTADLQREKVSIVVTASSMYRVEIVEGSDATFDILINQGRSPEEKGRKGYDRKGKGWWSRRRETIDERRLRARQT